MKAGAPDDLPPTIVEKPQACHECHTVSRLTNGLCLTCLLRGALDKDKAPSDKEAFREILSSVKSGG